MLNTIRTAFRIKDLRKKLLFTLGLLILVRLGAHIPIPGIEAEYFKSWFEENTNGTFNILSAFSGGSFERMSLFALGITPYITASIIIQLLGVVIPALEEIRKDGEYGRKKMEKITIITSIGLAFAESIAMAVGFNRMGILSGIFILRECIIVIFLTAGCGILVFMGEMIKKKGIGNGISLILAVNILSGFPSAAYTMVENLGKPNAAGIGKGAGILAVVLVTAILVVILNEAVHKIPVQYSQKMRGMKFSAARSFIPIKLNAGNVAPVIFASSIFSIPQLVASFAGKGYGSGVSAFILNSLNQNQWFNKTHPEYTIGLLVYVALICFFSVFYISIILNPMEMADNMKKQGGCIPGIRQGKPTELYIAKIINNVTVIGSFALILIVVIPTIFGNLLSMGAVISGTSLVIIVGVITETIQQIEAQTQQYSYSSFVS